MVSLLKYVALLIALLGIASLSGCGGAPGPDPEQAARHMFELEWSGNIDEAWNLLHPLWRRDMFQDNFASYANKLDEKNKAWADHPRTILRSKRFSGDEIPIRAQRLVKELGRDGYDFSVVRLRANYPKVEGYYGGEVEYLLTLVRKTKAESPWQILSCINAEEEPRTIFDW